MSLAAITLSPTDLGPTLATKVTPDAGQVRLTTVHDGLSFTACMTPVQARTLAQALTRAADAASRRIVFPVIEPEEV